MANRQMLIPNEENKITPSLDQNQWLKRLNTQLYQPTNLNALQSPKLLSQPIRKYCKTLGTSVITSPLSLLFLHLSMIYLLRHLLPMNKYVSHQIQNCREGGDIRLFITLVPKIGKFIKLSIQTLQPPIVIYKRGSFVHHHWGYRSIYRPLSYPCLNCHKSIK